jgi:hypothetical protein
MQLGAVFALARLSQLKFAMGTSIFVASFIFGLFLLGIIFLLQYYLFGLNLITGLLLVLGGIALFILFQYLVGPAIVAATSRLHYLKPGENLWLENTVKELKSLNEDEIRGVIAHELGHVKHKDFIVMTVLSALPLIAYIIAQFAFRAGVISSYSRGRDREGNAGIALIAIGVVSFTVYIITFLAVMRLSRLREHYADAYSAYLTGSPRSLESGLAKITYGLSISPKVPQGARAFYIGDPALAKQEISEIMEKKNSYDLDKDGVLDERELELAMEKESKSTWNQLNSLFATHPPTFKRILLLREIEQEMETGKYTSDRVYAHV